jgi:hypothetical protein
MTAYERGFAAGVEKSAKVVNAFRAHLPGQEGLIDTLAALLRAISPAAQPAATGEGARCSWCDDDGWTGTCRKCGRSSLPVREPPTREGGCGDPECNDGCEKCRAVREPPTREGGGRCDSRPGLLCECGHKHHFYGDKGAVYDACGSIEECGCSDFRATGLPVREPPREREGKRKYEPPKVKKVMP